MSSYLVNINTKEIHKLSNEHENCNLDQISTDHKEYLDYELQVDDLIKRAGYNGCYWCYREKHTD